MHTYHCEGIGDGSDVVDGGFGDDVQQVMTGAGDETLAVFERKIIGQQAGCRAS